MHGAAQTANAPPRSALEPRPRARREQARRDDPLGHRQRAEKREAEHDQDEAGDLELRPLVDHAPDRRRRGAEHDEHRREPGDERQARGDDPPPHAPLAEPRHVDGRDRREIAGDERQHARRQYRDEAGEERDRELLKHRSVGELVVDKPLGLGIQRVVLPSGSSSGRPGGAASRVQYQAPPPSASAPAPMPPIGSAQASRSKPWVAGVESTPGPEVRDHLVEDLLLRPALGDPPADLGLHLLRDGRVRLVERLVARRADEERLDVALARTRFCAASAGAAKREHERRGDDARDGEQPHALRARLMPAASDLSVTGPEHVRRDQPAPAVDEERLRRALADAVRPDGARRSGRRRRDRSRRSASMKARAGPLKSSTSMPTKRGRRRRSGARPPRAAASPACTAGSRRPRS